MTIINDEFVVETHVELDNPAAAKAQGLKGALEVGTERLLSGKCFFACEVVIADGEARERFVVSLGTSPIK